MFNLKYTGYDTIDWFYIKGDVALGKTSMLRNLPWKIFSLINLELTVRILGGYSMFVLAKSH
ncbi:MAG: hypothetical protein HS127_20540 [Planctomycetia bacterium]|nr:hypothetical protein [Planctomycetia bacterium]